MRDNDITALAQYEGRLLGSEQGLFLGSSAPLGQASRFIDRHLQGRVLQPGEHFSLLIENSGPGGFYTEIARTMVLGKASNELIDGFEIDEGGAGPYAAAAQAGRLLRRNRGKSHDELHARPRPAAGAAALRPRSGLRPGRAAADPRRRDHAIEQHMNLAVHPGYETSSIFAVICDNYLIEAGRPGRVPAPDPEADLRAVISRMTIDVLSIGSFPAATNAELASRFAVTHHSTSRRPTRSTPALRSRIRAIATEANRGADRALIAALPKLEIVSVSSASAPTRSTSQRRASATFRSPTRPAS